MQLISVNISNILSFPYQEYFSEKNKINFDINKKCGLNILIGPNGSGKTNFLRILTQIIKVGLIKDFVFTENQKNIKESIIENTRKLENMNPHFSYEEKPSTIEIELHISSNDKKNMIFIQENRNRITDIIETYSQIGYKIPIHTKEDIEKTQTLHLQFEINREDQTVIIYNKQKSKILDFVLEYIRYQELFQIAIMIHNTKSESGNKLSPLKNTFGYLHSNRNFQDIKDINIENNLREGFISKKNYNRHVNLTGYALCVKKINSIIEEIIEKENIDKNDIKGKEKIKEELKKSLFFISLKKTIKKYLDLELNILYENEKVGLYFIDSIGQKQNIHGISNGEQSLLIILLTIYGYDLKNGLLIIDEPELHFHPQMQKRLTKMLEKLNNNIGTQCIISTYSPIFIDEKNITNVYRFSKKNGETEIRIPDKRIGEDESSLIQILKFENAAKIFFVDKIIMVEGEIDAYFFEYYLQYLHNLPERKEKIINYEIININGKGSYKKWSTFLRKFGLEPYFIGDWDNSVDYGFITQQDLNFYYKQSKSYYHSRNKIDSHYGRLVNTVKNLYPNKYTSILENINKLYKENIFVLKKGDIETYLGIKSKGLEETINFCHHFFSIRLKNKLLKEHREELEEIIKFIFSKNN